MSSCQYIQLMDEHGERMYRSLLAEILPKVRKAINDNESVPYMIQNDPNVPLRTIQFSGLGQSMFEHILCRVCKELNLRRYDVYVGTEQAIEGYNENEIHNWIITFHDIA